MCLVGSFKFLPPDTQAFQSMMGSHKFSPYNGRCFDWRLSSLTIGMPDLLLTLSTMVADDGVEPPTEAYETSEIPFL